MSAGTQSFENGDGSQLAVTAAASNLSAPTVASANDIFAAEFYNNGSQTIYVALGSTATGNQAADILKARPIAAGAAWTDSFTRGPWYVYTASGTSDVRIAIARRRNTLGT